MKNFNYIIFAVFLILMLIPSAEVFADCSAAPLGLPNGSTCCPIGASTTLCNAFNCPPCSSVPLDGGLSALLIVGVAYGAKKMRGKLN